MNDHDQRPGPSRRRLLAAAGAAGAGLAAASSGMLPGLGSSKENAYLPPTQYVSKILAVVNALSSGNPPTLVRT